MTVAKTTVGILFGGQSPEHDVSLKSTAAIYAALDRECFEPVLIYISRGGLWHLMDEASFLRGNFDDLTGGQSFLPWRGDVGPLKDRPIDIYFPVLHGPNGEDGKIQGLLELAGCPYVGADGLSSGLAMDKAVARSMFRQAGLPVVDALLLDSPSHVPDLSALSGYPVFVKPCAMGSSVGVSRVEDADGLAAALELAFRYDDRVLVERAMDIREIEISVMGNREPRVSRPGELVPGADFYDYNDKYVDGKTTFHMPARLDAAMEGRVRDIAQKAFKALFLSGMARVDLFIEKSTNDIYVNEINTIPGFTEISMFPRLWQLEGISFTQLVTMLIDYGFRRHRGE